MKTIEKVRVAGTPAFPRGDAVLPPVVDIIQVDPDDSLDLLREAIGQASGRVIFLVPQWSSLFTQSDDFARLALLVPPTSERITFVVAPPRWEALRAAASQQGFRVFPSLEVALNQLAQDYAQASSTARDISRSEELLAPIPLPQSKMNHTLPVSHTRRPSGQQLKVPVLLFLLLLVVMAGLLFAWQAPVAPFTVGNFAFLSSGRLDPNSLKGLNDIVTLELHGIATPPSGAALYAWLEADPGQDSIKPILLGKMQVTGGDAQLTYSDPQHDNLLVTFSVLLVTQQDGSVVPVTPALDPATHLYRGAIPNIPRPGDEKHYSLLSHLRHLLAQDPTVAGIGLSGGLNVWLFRNSQAVLEEATTARDYWKTGAMAYMHRQITRILDYLDGYNYVWRDVPAGTPFLADRAAGQLGLLTFDQQQQPPGYVAHVSLHLDGLANSPGVSASQQALAQRLDKALTQVTSSYTRVHDDAAQLVRMSDAQLRGANALEILDDMATYANAAFAGPGPFGQPAEGQGIVGILSQMDSLAVVQMVGTTAT